MKKRRLISVASLCLLSFAVTSCSEKEPIRFEVSSFIEAANNYISENAQYVNTDLKNKYHLTAPIGWINDPNGFSEFNGKYHLFYQYNPYDAVWGPMHWGHQTTKDFIKWELEDVALAPDTSYDPNGCFSGTAIVDNGIHYLAYTAVTEYQNQALAYSYDGVTYKKLDELLIDGDDLPQGASNYDFRDPKIFKRDGSYYIICGNKNGQATLAMFKSDNITGPYEYANDIYSRNDISGVLECPDLVTINNKDILICSPQGLRSDYEYSCQNADSCIYLVGNLSVNTSKFYQATSTTYEEFDKGFSFYAPQTMQASDGRTIMVAWMRSWSEPNLTREDQWCGAMTLPRELTLKDNHIYQKPVKEINNYLKDKMTHNQVTLDNDSMILSGFDTRSAKITVDINVSGVTSGRAGIELFKGTNYSTKVYYDASR